MRLFSTDNEWDVPSLRLDMQATEVPTPVLGWGSVARTTRMRGTWHLYRDDSKFRALYRDPGRLVATGCAAAVEPNATTYDQSPTYEVIAAVGRKRAVARHWGDAGIRLFVDLNVPLHRWPDLLMLGVPGGWRAFATRAYAVRLDDLREAHAFASEWAGGEPLLLVVGGGAPAAALCRTLAGAVWVDDRDRAVATGQRERQRDANLPQICGRFLHDG